MPIRRGLYSVNDVNDCVSNRINLPCELCLPSMETVHYALYTHYIDPEIELNSPCRTSNIQESYFSINSLKVSMIDTHRHGLNQDLIAANKPFRLYTMSYERSFR